MRTHYKSVSAEIVHSVAMTRQGYFETGMSVAKPFDYGSKETEETG
jgi:hypothetical protein